MIDTHAHIYAEEFDQDRDDVVKRAVERGIEKIILANVDSESLNPLIETCNKYPDVCIPTIGLHPTSVDANYKQVLADMRARMGECEFKAIGEIGLDLYWDKTYREEQLVAFDEQLLWAAELDFPVIIHVRDAFDDLHMALSKRADLNLRGIIHSFSGDAEDVRRIRTYGDFYFGINGIVTFKKSTLPEVVKAIGAEHLVVETDAPYLAPVPHRGKRNEPAYVADTAQYIADTLEMDYTTLERITTENAKKLFKI